MKISCIYGKKVLSSTGKEGYVLGVFGGGNEINCLVCADSDETEFVLDFKKVKFSGGKITFKQGDITEKSGTSVRLGKPVFDCGGLYMGRLTDLTIEKNKITYAHVGKKKFSADDIVSGDAIIIRSSARILKSDVVNKKGKVIIKRGTPLSPEVAKKAQKHGEYVQTNLKTI